MDIWLNCILLAIVNNAAENIHVQVLFSFSFSFFFVVLGLELRAFTLSPLSQPFL
jgi:hypothetical protein